MTAIAPNRPFDPVFDSQKTFRAILDAMARPGSVVALGATDARCPQAEAAPLAAVARTLFDHEVTFAVAPGAEEGEGARALELARYLAAATGSRPTSPDGADFVIARAPAARGLIAGLKRGSLAFPDDGATLIILTEAVAPRDGGLTVTLIGPGVRDALATRLGGLSADDLAERQAANAEIPRGVDLLLIDPTGQVIGLPRTTNVGREKRGEK